MSVLCAIGLQRGPELLQRLALLLGTGQDLLLVYVIDTAPREQWERTPRAFRPRPHAPAEHHRQMEEAEQRSSAIILAEAHSAAHQLGFVAAVRAERGNPERILSQVAREVAATLMVVFARELADGHPLVGPPSVGHTARFVLDHAPCPVLLLR